MFSKAFGYAEKTQNTQIERIYLYWRHKAGVRCAWKKKWKKKKQSSRGSSHRCRAMSRLKTIDKSDNVLWKQQIYTNKIQPESPNEFEWIQIKPISVKYLSFCRITWKKINNTHASAYLYFINLWFCPLNIWFLIWRS